MSKNPYKVLGVSPDASDEEIKQAYRELVRKYHPDRHRDSGLEDLASEKMKEINAAHEEIMRQRAQKTSGEKGSENGGYQYGNNGGYQYGGNAGGNYNRQQYSYEAQSKFTAIRNCINAGNITEAERLLAEIENNDRGAEWHFLNGCILMRKGFYVDAQHAFDTAYRMEPTNNEYFRFKEQMNKRSGQFGGGYQTNRSSGCCDCDMCTSLICADCCCEMMGGDLISCC